MIQEVRTTRADAAALWALIGDVDSWADILPTMQQVTRRDGEGAVGVGARFELQQPGLPKAVYEITDWQPGRAFTWVAASPGVRTTAWHRLEVEPDGTRVDLGVEWSGPLAWLVRPLLGSKARRMVRQEADTFVRLAETARRRD